MLRLSRSQREVPYLFLLPAFIMIGLVFLFPIISVIADSMYSINGNTRTFVGFQNYATLTKNPIFWTALTNNFKFLLCVPLLVAGGVIMALILYTQFPGWKIYRTIMLFPYIFSIAVTGIVFDVILRENGLLNSILSSIGLGNLAHNWLGERQTALYAIMFVIIWKEFGYGVMLILARLLSVDESLIEAARLDGASYFTIARKILIPDARAVISFFFVLSMINMLSWLFNYVYVLTKGGPINSTYVLDFYIYQLGAKFMNYGAASALAVMLLVITMLFVSIQAVGRRMLSSEDA